MVGYLVIPCRSSHYIDDFSTYKILYSRTLIPFGVRDVWYLTLFIRSTFMSQTDELIEIYESMEQNKQNYTDVIEEFISDVNTCISSHDLPSLNSLFTKIYSLDDHSKKPFVFSSSVFRIESIKKALTLESGHGTELFWNDVTDCKGMLEKYNKTIFMLRRLNYDLPENYKQDAFLFLRNITPFFISSVFSDKTVLVGKPDYLYITLAMDSIRYKAFDRASVLLKLVHIQNDEIKDLIRKIEIMKSKTP